MQDRRESFKNRRAAPPPRGKERRGAPARGAKPHLDVGGFVCVRGSARHRARGTELLAKKRRGVQHGDAGFSKERGDFAEEPRRRGIARLSDNRPGGGIEG